MPEFLEPFTDTSLEVTANLDSRFDQPTTIAGLVLRVRRLSWGAFVVVSLPRFCVQCVLSNELEGAAELGEGDVVRLHGTMVKAKIKDTTIWPRNAELRVERLETLSKVTEVLPIDISKKDLSNAGLDLRLNTRPISLRHPLERAKFKLAEGLCQGFREALLGRGFTEIHTPKIVSAGAEGGSNIFKVEYFDRAAFLTQSPQFFKQMGVGIYGRVFEVAPVFRAEKHHTSRHINEYTSMDFEMGPIASQHEVMGTQVAVLRHMLELLQRDYALEIEMLGIDLPEIPERVPMVTVSEVHEICGARLGSDFSGEPDLDPAEEREIYRWVQEEHGSELVFVVGFPSEKRPFYAMDDPADPELTLSFDLLLRGQEITTGGQRIHRYDEQVEKLRRRGLDPEDFSDFLMIHRYGMPPHGGLGMGLERLLGRLLGADNIREATMFPRDVNRLSP